MKLLKTAALAACALLIATQAHAHVTLEKSEASAKSNYKAVFRVPHACGASPTTGLKVTLPEGVIAAKPMPKPGWTLTIEKGAYAHSYKHYSESVSEGAKTIAWSGGNLPDDQYDEFVITMFLADTLTPGTTLVFPTEQTCEKGANHWTAKPGETAAPGAEPAPVLKIAEVQGVTAGGTTAGAEYTLGALTIAKPWIRATPNGAKVAGGFVKITNNDHHPDRLLAASLESAGTTQIHEMKMEGDVMKMGELPNGLELPPHGTVTLEPAKLHLMFLDLKAPLKEGEHVKGTLTFEKAGKLDVEFIVKGLGATAP